MGNEQKVNEENKIKKEKKNVNECYFKSLNDALSEIQATFLRLSKYKNTLYSNDKIGLFLFFLFECLYSFFEPHFSKEIKYESYELTKAFRQHIYQTVYDQFWSKCLDVKNKRLFNEDKVNKRLKLKQPAYKLRINDNMLSYAFLMNLPGLNENCATQFGALYSMLGGIDDKEMDMAPLKPWIDQIDLSFNETYCMLLYLWFILDVELPAAPYNFIGKRSQKKNQNQNNNNNNNVQSISSPKQNKKNQHQNKPQHNKANKKQNHQKKKHNKKKQKTKPVVLFKMGGM